MSSLFSFVYLLCFVFAFQGWGTGEPLRRPLLPRVPQMVEGAKRERKESLPNQMPFLSLVSEELLVLSLLLSSYSEDALLPLGPRVLPRLPRLVRPLRQALPHCQPTGCEERRLNHRSLLLQDLPVGY